MDCNCIHGLPEKDAMAHTSVEMAMMRIMAATEIMVSIIVQVLKVSTTLILTILLTSQSLASFTCDRISKPAPVAGTGSS